MSDGFKSGASVDDPLGGGSDEEEEDEPVGESTTDQESQKAEDDSKSNQTTGSASETTERLPWIYRRDGITDGRAKTVQLHLQETTISTQREVRSELEETLGDAPRKADLREAALLVGLAHLDETAGQLREWGYGVE